MPEATRLGDNNTGHDACPATALISASGDVIINGKGAGRVGDNYAEHRCVAHPSHSGVIADGSSTVFINGKAAGRIGDPISCGGAVAVGSGNVIIGG
nr:MAG TPA_asm: Baseplate wedge protein [Caudoviricetes sp.]